MLLIFSRLITNCGFFRFCWPHKHHWDNAFRAATEIHVFLTMLLGLVLKYDLTYEQLSRTFYEWAMFWSFMLLVPVGFLVTVAAKLSEVWKVLDEEAPKPDNTDESKDSGAQEMAHGTEDHDHGHHELDPLCRRRKAFRLCRLGLAEYEERKLLERWFKGWSVKKRYAAFLSHFKAEAGVEARVLHTWLVRCLRPEGGESQIFLDSDNLSDLRKLRRHVQDSDVRLQLDLSSATCGRVFVFSSV